MFMDEQKPEDKPVTQAELVCFILRLFGILFGVVSLVSGQLQRETYPVVILLVLNLASGMFPL